MPTGLKSSRRSALCGWLFWPFCFIAPILLFVAVSVWNGVFPFGPESFLTEDLKYQYIDFFTWYREVLLGRRDIFYSFSQALGSNTWGLFSYYLASPFNLLIVLFDENHLVEFVYLVTALKLGCIQVSCAWFLSRRFPLRRTWIFTLSLCFAWCSWVATQLRNPLWLDALVLLPCMAYASFVLIRKGKMLPLAACTAIDIIVCWYMAYMSILFTCLYVLFELACLILDDGNSVSGRWIAGRALRFIAALLLGLLLSAWTFLPTLRAMMGGSTAQHLGHIVRCTPIDLVKGFLPGGYALNRTPQFFTGSLVTVLAFAYLCCKRIDGRLRLISLALIALLVASAVFSPLEYVWCGFRVPNGFYSRIAFFASFFAIWMAARYLQSRNGLPHKPSRPLRLATACALLALTACELLVNAHLSWNSLYTGYPQETHEAYLAEACGQMKELRAMDSSEFYRVDKTYTRAGAAALNEGLALDFKQLSSYSSANSPRAVSLLNALGYSSEGEFSTRYSQPLLATDALFGVKYVASNGSYAGYQPIDIAPSATGAVWSSNPYALSLGFAVSSETADSGFPVGSNPFERQNALFSLILGQATELYRPLKATALETSAGKLTWSVDVPANCIGYAWVIKGASAGSYSTLALSVDGAAPVSEGWRFDHTLRQIASISPDRSTHTVTLTMADATASMPKDTGCVFYALDMARFAETIDRIKSQQVTVQHLEDGHVDMTYGAQKATTLLLTIPYDRGWTVQVNGERVELHPAFDGGLSTVRVPKGSVTITMDYLSPGFTAGCAISALSLAAVFVGMAIRRIKMKRG